MLGNNNGNSSLPVFFGESRFQYPANAANQLQLFGNMSYEFNGDPANDFGNEKSAAILRPNKRGREAEPISSQQKLQISLNSDNYNDEVDRTHIPNQNPVSTGLRLSYDDEERNSSVTSASGSMTAASSIIWSISGNIRTELDRQKEEFDQYFKMQEEYLAKGLRDMKKRHVASFISAIQKGVNKKLQEKDLELENINRKNRELAERMTQVATEAQQWCYRAKYNESVVNILKTKLQQAMQGAADQGKEGFGDSENDDAASCIDPNNHLSVPGGSGKSPAIKGNMICRACKAKELHLGVNSGALKFTIEQQAVNEATFRCPDELGWQPQQLAIIPGDGGLNQTRKTSCSIEAILQYLKKKGHDVVISDDAGRFVCNYVYYHSLRFAEQKGHRSLFVHVPLFSKVDEKTQMQFTLALLEAMAAIS